MRRGDRKKIRNRNKKRKRKRKVILQPRKRCFHSESVSKSKIAKSNLARRPLGVHIEGPGGCGEGTSSIGAGVDAVGGVLCRVACQR